MDSRSNSSSAVTLPSFHPIPLKLDRTNYAFWRAQVLPTIRAHGFEEFIATTAMPPSPFLPATSGAPPRQNPEYALWIRRDQFLLSWMLASIGESMLGHVVRCATAREVWAVLERLSFSQSRARVMQLRMSLQTTKKLSLTVEEYFLKMRNIADQLSAVGQVITDDDLMMYILAGFGMEYEALVVNFMQRSDSPTLQEAQLAFQSYEQRLAQHTYAVMDPSVNVTYYGGGRGPLGRGSGGGRGALSKSSSAKAVICQLCGKIGHLALRCFKRFDVHFTGESNANNSQVFLANASQDSGGDESTWYLDSGATNHITHELANLQISSDYTGAENVMVGNGQNLQKDSAEGHTG